MIKQRQMKKGQRQKHKEELSEKEIQILTEAVQQEIAEESDEIAARVMIREFDEDMISTILQLATIEGKKELYVSSPGGLATGCNILVDLINQDPENYTIKITEQIASAAFMTCLYSKCKIVNISNQINFFTVFMHHSPRFPGKVHKEVKKISGEKKWSMYNAIKHVLTPKQQKQATRYIKWTNRFRFLETFMNDDLYLSDNQMQLLLGDRYSVEAV